MPKLTTIRKQALDEMMREAIYRAALTVLAERGVDGMTMDRVATAANVAKGSLYHYFPGKRALLELVHAKMIDPIVHHLDEIVATQQPAVEKLAAHLRRVLERIAEHAQVFRLLFEDEAARGLLQSAHRRSQEAGSRRLAEICRQGVAEGAFRPAEPSLLTQMFLGLCRGVLDTQPALEKPEQREAVHRLIMGTLLYGIAAERCPGGGEPRQ